MGACTSVPSAESGGVETNTSPVHTFTTQVKEKPSQQQQQQEQGELHAVDGVAATASAGAAAGSDAPAAAASAQSGPKEGEESKEEEPVTATAEATAPSTERRPSTSAQSRIVTPRVNGLSAAEAAASHSALPTDSATAIASGSPSTPSVAAPPTFAAPSVSSSASASASLSPDDRFRDTVKTVLVLLLDRLTRTMEYEKAAFQELAAGVGYANYMQLFEYTAFEAFLRRHFRIPPSPAPHQQDNDLRYLSQYFALFLTLAQNAPSEAAAKPAAPSRAAMTAELQTLCADTAVQLLKWRQSPHATFEVREHFTFFSAALGFPRGDLVHNPDLLYKNIDDICD